MHGPTESGIPWSNGKTRAVSKRPIKEPPAMALLPGAAGEPRKDPSMSWNITWRGPAQVSGITLPSGCGPDGNRWGVMGIRGHLRGGDKILSVAPVGAYR